MKDRTKKSHLSTIRSDTQALLGQDTLCVLDNALKIMRPCGKTHSLRQSLSSYSTNYKNAYVHSLRLLRKAQVDHTLSSLECELLLALYMLGDRKMRTRCHEVTSRLFVSQESVQELPLSLNEYFIARRAIFQSIPFLAPHSLPHICRFPRYFFGSIQGTSRYQTLFGKIIPFDPKGDLGNSSGILYEERDLVGSYSIDWNIGPTPTIGTDISPEAQSMRSILDRKEKGLSTSEMAYVAQFIPYDGWAYVNLQNRRNRDESARVRSIESFASSRVFIASLSVDSPYYSVQYDPVIYSLEGVRDRFKEFFRSKEIFSISSDSWYFFSLSQAIDQEKWQKALLMLLEKAYLKVVDSSYASLRSLHKAFHELLIYSIARAWQGFALFKLKSTGIDRPSLFSTITCREGVDRGGAFNGGMISILASQNKKDLIENALVISLGRPILFRGRLNEEERLEGFFSLIALFPIHELSAFLHESLLLGYEALSFK